MDKRTRLVGLLLLVVVLGTVCVGYGTADRWDYPRESDIEADPSGVDGERTLLWGDVNQIDEANATLDLVVEETLRFEVTNVEPTMMDAIGPGSYVHVVGTLQDDSQRIVAERTVIEHRTRGDWQFLIGLSILGGLLAAGVFLRFWTVDRRSWGFRNRGDR